jgi:hydroxyacylglutathione hydrolase
MAAMEDFRVGVLPVTPFRQNCTLLWEPDTRRALLVDPGGDADQILAAIAGEGLLVETILLTHGHLDHAGAAAEVKAALDAQRETVVPIIGPDARDAFLLADIEAQQARFGVTGLHNCTPDRFLAEGDTVVLGKLTFDVLHCPGHSPGSLVYVEKARRFALVGDVIFRGSVGRTDLPYGDQAALIAAIHDKLLPLGDDIAFVCGHGPGSTFGAERRSNPFLQEERLRSDR